MTKAPAPSPRTALLVANEGDADSGYVGERLRERGYSLRTVLRERHELPADLSGLDAVVLLGSEWSVHSPVDAAALAAECDLVVRAQQESLPLLGICYGAQVVAAATGGRVSLAATPEVGFVDVESVDEELVPAGPWAQFHLDVVEVPPAARVVARNSCGIQAFVLPGLLAVQFHPEVTPATLDEWSARFPEMLVEVGTDRAALVAQAHDREPAARQAAYDLVDAFLDGAPWRHPPSSSGQARSGTSSSP